MSISLDFGREIVDRVLEKGVDDVVVRLQERVYELILFDSGVLRSFNVTKGSGVGIKVSFGGSTGYSYTSSLDRESIAVAIEK
ncbi:MAG: DNA gyrase modulator, partial [Ignisphaera sp.]